MTTSCIAESFCSSDENQQLAGARRQAGSIRWLDIRDDEARQQAVSASPGRQVSVEPQEAFPRGAA